MPKDNSLLPNDNPQPTAPTPPPVLEDVVLPPMLGKSDPSVSTSSEQPKQDTGSAAPTDDIIMPTTPISSNPRKKFAGGKVIATILGLFLLVGGLGAGVMLVGQNQNIEEQAGCYSTCLREIGDDFECRQVCGRQDGSDGNTPATNNDNTNVEACECEAGYRCNRSGNCVSESSIGDGGVSVPAPTDLGKSCDGPSDCGMGFACVGTSLANSTCVPTSSVVIPAGVTLCDAETPGVPESIGKCCVPGGGTSYNYETNQPFNGTHWTTCAPDYNCNQNVGCLPSGSSGGGGGTPSNPPAPTPTAPPVITASCQNIKAYSASNWTLLTSANLAALKAGDSVNFCVAGVASGGSFNKAKFTINGSAQAETTTLRPNSTDYCQLYVIPAGVSAFNVSAQINHVTLGWK